MNLYGRLAFSLRRYTHLKYHIDTIAILWADTFLTSNSLYSLLNLHNILYCACTITLWKSKYNSPNEGRDTYIIYAYESFRYM